MQDRDQMLKPANRLSVLLLRLVPTTVLLLNSVMVTAAEPADRSTADSPEPHIASDYADVGEGAPLLSLPSPFGDLRYTPGHGLRLGETGITIGGYTNLDLSRDEGGPARLDWDELSVIVIADPVPRVHLFSEYEFEHLVQVDDHGRGGTANADSHVERLYGDFSVSDWLNFRAGKFLTPVGRWNVIHASPLVWTTSRPLVTFVPFDTHTTGAMLFGSLFPTAGTIRYSLLGQFADQFDATPQPQTADRSGGARLEYATRADAAIGASYLAFRSGWHWRHLAGLDLLWRRGPLDLMGEFTAADVPHASGPQWGVYLQSALEVCSRFYLVGRYEHFAPPDRSPDLNLVVLGVAFRPTHYFVLKAEYLIADHPSENSPPGLKSSLAVLF